MQAVLIPLNGGPRFEIGLDFAVIGRSSNSDVRLPQKSVSNEHCVMVLKDGLLTIRDLNSSNGTFIDEQRIQKATVKSGTKIAFGTLKYLVEISHPYHDQDAILLGDSIAVPSASNTAKLNIVPAPPVDHDNVLHVDSEDIDEIR